MTPNSCNRHDALCSKQQEPPQTASSESAVAQSPNMHQRPSCTQHVPPPPLSRSAQLPLAGPSRGLHDACPSLTSPSPHPPKTEPPRSPPAHSPAEYLRYTLRSCPKSQQRAAGPRWLHGPLCKCTRVEKPDKTCQERWPKMTRPRGPLHGMHNRCLPAAKPASALHA